VKRPAFIAALAALLPGCALTKPTPPVPNPWPAERDDTAYIQSLIAATPAGGRCSVPAGTYWIRMPIVFPRPMRFSIDVVSGRGRRVIQAQAGDTICSLPSWERADG
jgi:hypothetical protein